MHNVLPTDWLPDWLTDWQTERQTDRQTDRQNWLAGWLADWLTDWFVSRMVGWLVSFGWVGWNVQLVPSTDKGWLRMDVHWAGFTYVNKLKSDVWTAWVNVKGWALFNFFLYARGSHIACCFINARKVSPIQINTHVKFTRQWKSTLISGCLSF